MHFTIHSFILPEAVAPPEFDARIEKVDVKSLPPAFDQYQRFKFGAVKRETGGTFYGERSKVWIYSRPGQSIAVSLDYPFPSFHDLSPCYVGQGWHVVEAKVIHELPGAGRPAVWQEMRMSFPGGRSGYVVYAEFNPEGDALEGESRLTGAFYRNMRALQALYDYVFRHEEFTKPKPLGPAYQIQAMIQTDGRLSPETEQELQQVFFAAVRELSPQIFEKK
jgi:hypothetical protein